jgi:hypothetical protein
MNYDNSDYETCWYQKIDNEWWVICDGVTTRQVTDPKEIEMAEECNKNEQ